MVTTTGNLALERSGLLLRGLVVSHALRCFDCFAYGVAKVEAVIDLALPSVLPESGVFGFTATHGAVVGLPAKPVSYL